jgi:cytochrome c-type biogenesis protein CcmE
MSRKQKRLAVIGVIGTVLLSAALLVMTALRDEIVFFFTPTDIIADGKAQAGQRVRIGGLVKDGSIEREGENVRFVVTDTEYEIRVAYTGLLPDLFREGQGVVAEGTITTEGGFSADTVLAKHDENYIPREVADALKERVWQGENQ